MLKNSVSGKPYLQLNSIKFNLFSYGKLLQRLNIMWLTDQWSKSLDSN